MRIGPFTIFEKKSIEHVELDELIASGPTAAGVRVTVDTCLRVPAVAAAIRTISEATATLGIKVVKVDAKGEETAVTDHPVAELLRGRDSQINDWTSRFEFIRSLVVDALIHDRGGLARVGRNSEGKPVEIIRYRPGYIQVNYPDDTLRPEYRIQGQVQAHSDIVHLRGAFDKSPVTLAREAIGTAMAMEKHAGKIFGAGGRPSGTLESPKPIGDAGVAKMIAGWKKAFEGEDKGGGTAVLWDGTVWKPVTLSSVDNQFQQLRLFAMQEIARAFNMPPSLLGDLTRATWSNSAEMQRQFLLLCLEPWLQALEASLGRALFSAEDRNTFAIRFDRDDFTNVDLVARATAINGLRTSMTLTRNEGRSWLDLPPVEGGDTFENPNTGTSQPGNANPTDNPDDTAALRRKIEELTDAAE